MKFRQVVNGITRLPFSPEDFRLVQWLVIEPQLSEVEAQFITSRLIAQRAAIDRSVLKEIEFIHQRTRLHDILRMLYMKGKKNAN